MPLHGRTRQAGRGLVVVIGAAATITPMVVWHVASNDVGRYIEAACQFLVVAAVLAHILRWRAVTGWLNRIGLGRDDPPAPPDERQRNDAERSSRNTRTASRRTWSSRSPGPRVRTRPARSRLQPRCTGPATPRRTREPRQRASEQPANTGPAAPTDLGWLA